MIAAIDVMRDMAVQRAGARPMTARKSTENALELHRISQSQGIEDDRG